MDASAQRDATGPDAGPNEDATISPDAANQDATANEDATVEEDATVNADAGDAGMQGSGEVIVRSGVNGLGFQVFFHDPNGELISAKTATAGEARELVPPNSMVTVYPLILTGKGPDASPLRTITGVQPGEIYEVLDTIGVEIIGDLSVSLPSVLPDALYYSLEFGCGEFSIFDPMMPEVVGVEARCAAITGSGLLVTAIAYNQDGLPIAYAADETVQLVPQGTASVTLGPWRKAFDSLDTEIANPPPDAVDVFLSRALLAGPGRLVERAAGLENPTVGSTFSFLYPPVGEGSAVEIFVATSDFAINGMLTFPVGRNTVRVDLAADLLPRASVGTIDRSDAARPTISWTTSTGTADATIVTFRYSNPDINWSITAPANSSSMRLPELPDEFSGYRPTASSEMQSGILDLDLSEVAGYDVYRRGIGSVLFLDFERTFRTRPIGTTLRLTANPPDVGPF